MEPALTLFSVIMLLGAAHGLFLSLALINTRDALMAGRLFLALLTLSFAVDLGHEFLYQSRYLLRALALAYVDPVINLAYGPCLYLYVRALTEGKPSVRARTTGLHLIPVVLAAVACLLLPELSAPAFERLFYDDAEPATIEEVRVQQTIGAIALASVFSLGFYLFLSIRRLLLHARMVRQQFSSIEKITLNWLTMLLVAISVLYVMLIVGGFFSGLLGLPEDLNGLLYLVIVCVIYAMGYMGLRQPAIFTDRETGEPKVEHKYRTSALDAESGAALSAALQRHMLDARPYLESQLTLPQLAQELGISPNYLSQVINEQLHKNFFDFVNEYRVAEAKSMLAREEARSANILHVAYDSGFNSKSAFYTAFRKHVGMTPGEFRKSG